MIEQFDLLTQQGCLGYYDRVEVNVIFLLNADNDILNLFTIAIAEEAEIPEEYDSFLTSNGLIRVNRDYRIGILRKYFTVREARSFYSSLLQGNHIIDGNVCQLGSMVVQSKKYCPQNDSKNIILNKCLKNNFNGAYIIELFDVTKDKTKQFIDDPKLLLKASEIVKEFLPIGLEALSDRVGNVLFQFPIDIVQFEVSSMNNGTEIALTLFKHPKYNGTQDFRYNITYEDDGLVLFEQEGVITDKIQFPINEDCFSNSAKLFNPEGLLLQYQTNSYIRQMGIDTNIGTANRVRTIQLPGETEPIAISIGVRHQQSAIGEGPMPWSTWISGRRYKEEMSLLLKEQRFGQFPDLDLPNSEYHSDALRHLRALINRHANRAEYVLLCDPFLNAHDIVKTLLFCTINIPLKAISSKKAYERLPSSNKNRKKCIDQILGAFKNCISKDNNWNESEQRATTWKTDQKKILGQSSNSFNLNLEFRLSFSNYGWDFHDRFLLFSPLEEQPAKGYSLGTSINSLGKSHHIIQELSHPQAVLDQMNNLWEALESSESIVWKHP